MQFKWDVKDKKISIVIIIIKYLYEILALRIIIISYFKPYKSVKIICIR